MFKFILFAIIFIILIVINYSVYSRKYDKLAVFSRNAMVMDVLVWLGAGGSMIILFYFYDQVGKYSYLLWVPLIFLTSSFSIHLVRFIVGNKRNQAKKLINQQNNEKDILQ